MRRLLPVFALLVVGCTASGSSTPDEINLGYTVMENCTTTSDCGADGGVNQTVYSYDTSNESNWYPDGGATFMNPNNPDGSVGTPGGGDTPGGGGSCSQQTSCNPSCKNTGNGDVCGSGGGSVPPGQGGCWVTGGGYIVDADGHDSFGGNAMPMKAGYVRGQWEEQDHGTGNKAHGTVDYIVCNVVPGPGPGQPSGPTHKFDINQVYFGGPARWFSGGKWADGFWFDVMVEDHGEPGNTHAASHGNGSGVPDVYHFTIRQLASATQSGPVIYDTKGDLVGGNIQIHPPNNGHPYSGGTLPPWVSLQP